MREGRRDVPGEHERWKAPTNEQKVAEEIEDMRYHLAMETGILAERAEDGARIIVALQHLEAYERGTLIDGFDEAAVAAAYDRNKRARTPPSASDAFTPDQWDVREGLL